MLMLLAGCAKAPHGATESATVESPCPDGATYERVEHAQDEWLGACYRQNGTLHGPQRHVVNGQPLWERAYWEGELVRERRWHASGGLAAERSMIGVSRDNDVFVPNGRARRWYPDGQLESEGFYTRGERVGVWRFWYASGQTAAEITFGEPLERCEQRLTTRVWNEEGAETALRTLEPALRTAWRLDEACEGGLAGLHAP